jgi:DNA-binding Lrp family transcriptional regulator
MRLDKKDKQLLNLLYLHSRMSFSQMGKKLKLSGSSVERRVRKLKKAGIINFMFAAANHSKLGLKPYRLYFKFDVMNKKTEKQVKKIFQDYKRTVWGVICEGEYDVLWRIVAYNEKEVEDAAYIFIEKFGKHIIEKTIVASTYQTFLSWNKAFECKREPEVPIEEVASTHPIDEFDMLILASLNDNSRATTIELSQFTNLSPDAIRYRIKRLKQEQYILSYTAWFDARKLGFEYHKILITFRSITREDEKKFLKYCLENDYVVFLNKCIGGWDIELDVIVHNINELHYFIADLKTKFAPIIGKHTFITAIFDSLYNPLRDHLE